MAKVILHIGQGKTGTSSLQEALTLNRNALIQVGIYYPIPRSWPRTLRNGIATHNGLSRAIVQRVHSGGDVAGQWSRMVANAKRHECDTILLSGEDFFGGHPRTWAVGEETFWRLYERKVHHVHHFFRGHHVEVVAYVREPQEWATSAAAHWIRKGPFEADPFYFTPERFVQAVTPLLDYKRLFDTWLNPEFRWQVRLHPYASELMRNGDIFDDFAARHLPEFDGLHHNRRRSNVALGKAALDWLALNTDPTTPTWLSRSREHILTKACQADLGHLTRYELPSEINSQLEPVYERSRRYLAHNLGMFCGDASIVPSPPQHGSQEFALVSQAFDRRWNSLWGRKIRWSYRIRELLRESLNRTRYSRRRT